jgi:hypothetical protein
MERKILLIWKKNFSGFFIPALICTATKPPSIYVFPEKELRGLSPNFYIHVSVSDSYIPQEQSTYFPAAE